MSYRGLGVLPLEPTASRRGRSFAPPSPGRRYGLSPPNTYVGSVTRYARGGYAGFGLDVPTPLPGLPDRVANMQATGYNYCGDKFGFQVMLSDLGYYPGAIDGKIGSGTINAAKAAADQFGVALMSGGGLSNTFCQKLMSEWQAAMGTAAVPAPVPKPVPTHIPAEPPPPTRTTTQPPNGVIVNGNGVAVTNGQSALDKAKSWWNSQPTGMKIGIGVGVVAVAGLIIYAIAKGGKKRTLTATANRRHRRRYKSNRVTRRSSAAARKAIKTKVRGERGRVKRGKIITLNSGKRFGHVVPPKRYWKMGARRQSDYAWPEGYKYPLVFRGPTGKVNRKRTQVHIRSASSYFGRNKRKYPMNVRRKIARNINKAKKQYGVGGKVIRP